MKLCFSTLGCAEKGLDEIITLCNRFGFDALELRGIGGELVPSKMPEFSPENIGNTRGKFLKNGIKPISLDLSFSCHAVGKNEDEIKAIIPELDIAAELKIPYIRVFGNKLLPTPDTAYGNIVYSLKSLCRLAEDRGLTILLEIHGDINSIESIDPILRAMEGEMAFGLLWDIAHSDMVYGEDWEFFYEHIRPLVRHLHIKDHLREPLTLTDIGKGEIPIKPITRRLLADGFEGYFSLEWEKKWHPELKDIEVAIKDFLSLMAEV